MIIGAKRLANAQHDARHIIVYRIAQGKPDCQTDYAGTAKHGAEQCRRVENVQADKYPDHDEKDADEAGNQFGQKDIRRDAFPEPHARGGRR